jgi:hypothetical protein
MRTLLLAECLAVLLAVALPAPGAGAAPEKKLELIPLFTASGDEPAFAFEYKNDSDTSVDLVDLMAKSTITLDGTVYPRHSLKFAGNMRLAPGQSWNSLVEPSAYLPPGRQRGYDTFLGRMLWSVPLEPGRHEIALVIGGKSYAPVVFVWRDSTGSMGKR